MDKKFLYKRPPPPVNLPITGRQALLIIADLFSDLVGDQLTDWPKDDRDLFKVLLCTCSQNFSNIRDICWEIKKGKVDAELAYYRIIELVSEVDEVYKYEINKLSDMSDGLRHLVYEVRRSVKRLAWYAKKDGGDGKTQVG